MYDYKYLIREREDFQRSFSFKKVVKIGVYLLIGIFTLSLIIFGMNSIKKHKISIFKVRNIELIGIYNAPKAQLSNVLKKYKNKSLTELDLKKIYDELIKIPWIDDVIIRKRYPSTLIVKVIEKTPVAILETDKKFYLIDAQGRIIDVYKNRFYSENFVIFKANSIKNYKKTIEGYVPKILETLNKEGLTKYVSDISLKDGKISMILDNPRVKIIISPDEFVSEIYKVKILRKFKDYNIFENVKYVNLDYKDRIYLVRRR